jgi:hypothetical protein
VTGGADVAFRKNSALVGLEPALFARSLATAYPSASFESRVRMTTALEGHAVVNSMDALTDGGTSSRVIGWKPNFGK